MEKQFSQIFLSFVIFFFFFFFFLVGGGGGGWWTNQRVFHLWFILGFENQGGGDLYSENFT